MTVQSPEWDLIKKVGTFHVESDALSEKRKTFHAEALFKKSKPFWHKIFSELSQSEKTTNSLYTL